MPAEGISFSDLIASSIHDMKNSLNVQVGALENIAAQCLARGDEQSYRDLGLVIYQGNRMDANLVQLLCLYKLEKEIYPIDISEHALRDVIDDVLLEFKSMMEFKKIAVSVDCDLDCYWYFDRDLVTGILTNALNNAFHYTDSKIHIIGKVQNNYLELRVEDNGTGYPAGMLTDTGVSSHRGVKFATGSTGLGFYFSSQVAYLHTNGGRHGSLAIENGGTLGGGCFIVRLP